MAREEARAPLRRPPWASDRHLEREYAALGRGRGVVDVDRERPECGEDLRLGRERQRQSARPEGPRREVVCGRHRSWRLHVEVEEHRAAVHACDAEEMMPLVEREEALRARLPAWIAEHGGSRARVLEPPGIEEPAAEVRVELA